MTSSSPSEQICKEDAAAEALFKSVAYPRGTLAYKWEITMVEDASHSLILLKSASSNYVCNSARLQGSPQVA